MSPLAPVRHAARLERISQSHDGNPDVLFNYAEQGFAGDAPLIEFQRRNPQAVMKYLRVVTGYAARYATSQVR